MSAAKQWLCWERPERGRWPEVTTGFEEGVAYVNEVLGDHWLQRIVRTALLADGAPEVLLVVYDAPLPAVYGSFADEPDAGFAWCWRLVHADPALPTLRLAWGAEEGEGEDSEGGEYGTHGRLRGVDRRKRGRGPRVKTGSANQTLRAGRWPPAPSMRLQASISSITTGSWPATTPAAAKRWPRSHLTT